MGQPKGELVVGGSRLVDRAVATLRAGGCDPITVVVRPGTQVAGGVVVVNPDPARGMRSSLELALDAAHDCDALAMLLADMPGVAPGAVTASCRSWRPGRIVVATYSGVRGHPIVMAPGLWREALTLARPDEGARALLRERPQLVDEVSVTGDATDLDTPQDLARWSSGH